MKRIPDVLCINLDRSQKRWEHIQRTLTVEFGDHMQLRRIAAVDGSKDIDRETLQRVTTPYCRWGILNPIQICDPYVNISSMSAVGCYLSHMACWKWVIEHPSVPWALVVEDDMCAHGLRNILTKELDFLWSEDARTEPPFDFLVLGYREWTLQRFNMTSPQPPAAISHSVKRMSAFWGSHAYIVSQSTTETHATVQTCACVDEGAKKLTELCLPMDMELDAFLTIVCHTDNVRGFLLHKPRIAACLFATENTIPHFKFDVVPANRLLIDCLRFQTTRCCYPTCRADRFRFLSSSSLRSFWF